MGLILSHLQYFFYQSLTEVYYWVPRAWPCGPWCHLRQSKALCMACRTQIMMIHLRSCIWETSFFWNWFTSSGDRNVWGLCCFGHLECWLHCDWASYMCTSLLWSPAYASSIPYCSGFLQDLYLFSLLSFMHYDGWATLSLNPAEFHCRYFQITISVLIVASCFCILVV